MTLTQLAPPYPIFTDKSGTPLDNGYLYFGTANLNPETNPITVYYDRGLTQPVAQPVRTSAGYVMRNGSPAAIYANGEFSVTVRDKKKALVIYSPVGFGVVPGIPFATFDNAAKDVTALLANATFTYSAGVPNTVQVAAGDVLRTLTEGFAYKVAASGATDQSITTAGGVKLYAQASDAGYNVKAFGAVGNGTTDDTVSFQKAVDTAAGKTLVVPSGTSYKLSTINLQSNSEYQFNNAIFYPGVGTGDSWLFGVTGKTKVKIVGGVFSVASFTPVGTYSPAYSTIGTSWPNGYFYGGTSIYINSGSSYVEISGSRFEGQLTGVNVYNSSYCSVHHTTHYNGIAGLAALVNVAGGEMYGIQFNDNTIIGCGDDGIAVLCGNTSGTSAIYSSVVSRNYIDKSRLFAAAILSAVGIRTGYWSAGGTGKLISCIISENVMRDMVTEGLRMQNLEDCVIESNTVTSYASLGGNAFVFGSSVSSTASSSGVIFAGNTCRNPSTVTKALDMNYVTRSTFSNNRLRNGNSDSTLGGVENSYNNFIGNTFYNAVGPAIRFTGTSDYNVFSGDNFYDTVSPYLVRSGVNDVIGVNGNILRLQQVDVGSNTSIAPDVQFENYIAFRCVGGMTALTMSAASGTIFNGQNLVISVRNQAAGNVSVTWDASYKIAAWGALATGFTRSVTLRYNTNYSVWTEISRSSDIAN